MNRAAVAEARFNRHGGERGDFDLASGQAFDIKTQQKLNRFQRNSGATDAQGLVAAARFQGVIAAPRARVSRNQTGARPAFELLDRNRVQGFRAGSQASERCFGIDERDFARQRNYAASEANSISMIFG